MGVKRSFEDDDFLGVSLKQSKHFDQDAKNLALHTKDFSSDITSPDTDFPGGDKNYHCKFFSHTDGVPVIEKESETSAPLSWVTSSSSEEDSATFKSYFPEYFDFAINRQIPDQFENQYPTLSDYPPRKEVPVGPDHQAEIPSRGTDVTFEQKLTGTCIIPMPDYSTIDEIQVGRGRIDCTCLDSKSARCIQQHVKESREELRTKIGDEKFTDLGFYEMGEEVSSKWTPQDEHLFHEIVYSSPTSLSGRNFWRQLSFAFSNRTKSELVSYYFNVLVLRRRGVQNRNRFAEIDSDDDYEQSGASRELYVNESDSDDSDIDDDDDDGGGDDKEGKDEDDSIVDFRKIDGDEGWNYYGRSSPGNIHK